MSMDGKRFGAGILGGIMVGLLVIGTTGLVTFGGALFGSFSAANVTRGTDQTATATTAASSTSSVPVAVGQPQGPTTTTTTTYAISTSTSANGSTPASNAAAIFGFPVLGQKNSSHLENIASQPVTVDGIVLIPIVLALILGIVIYRLVSARREKGEAEYTNAN